jgi:hypothetical protein
LGRHFKVLAGTWRSVAVIGPTDTRAFQLDGTSLSATTVQARYSTAEIATTLEIAPSTVADPIRKIYARLDVHSMRELSEQINQRMLRRKH